METLLVRLRPFDPRRGHVLRRYSYAGIRFQEERGWYRVSDSVAQYLRGVRQVASDPNAPPAFDVHSAEDARALELQEEKEAQARTSATEAVELTPARPEGDGQRRPGRPRRDPA